MNLYIDRICLIEMLFLLERMSSAEHAGQISQERLMKGSINTGAAQMFTGKQIVIPQCLKDYLYKVKMVMSN